MGNGAILQAGEVVDEGGNEDKILQEQGENEMRGTGEMDHFHNKRMKNRVMQLCSSCILFNK